MRYTVIWQPHAEQKLAAIWNDAVNRQAVTAAADWIDAALENDAHLLGESLYGTMRVVVEPPLAVYFDVSQQANEAYVLTLRCLPELP